MKSKHKKTRPIYCLKICNRQEIKVIESGKADRENHFRFPELANNKMIPN